MPVLGLVLLLDDAQLATRDRVAALLADATDLDLGEPAQHRWPIVLEADSEHDAQRRIQTLLDLPGIAGVDVVYADFEDLLECSGMTGAREEL